jgi:gliding motility-associated-like protein
MGKSRFTFLFLFVSIFLFGQHKPNQKKVPTNPVNINGFDAKAAWQLAKQRTKNPKAQREIFETIQKRYDQEHHVVKNNSTITAPVATNYRLPSNNNSPFSANCPNAGFEDLNFTNWVGDTWTNSTFSDWPTVTPAWTAGIVTMGNNTPVQAFYSGFTTPTPNRHTVMTIPPTVNNPPNTTIGWDSIAINPVTFLSDIPFVSPTGNGSSVRLGNANTGAETEELSYSMPVSAQNSSFTFSYALVLNSGGHPPTEQPFFQVNIFDQAGNPIPGCGSYEVDAQAASHDPTFHTAVSYSGGTWSVGFDTTFYKTWTLVGVDLTAYIGQTVTITFRTADCSLGGHFGYAYIDASCSPVQAIVNMCAGLTTQQVVGPAGYVSYQWYGPNSNTLTIPAPTGTNDTLTIHNGNTGDTYYLDATSANGCVTHLQAVLQNSQVSILSVNSTPSCIGGSSGTANVVPSGDPLGLYNYNWTNSAGASVGTTQTVTGLAPGTYTVNITSANCGAHDTTVTVLSGPFGLFVSSTSSCVGGSSGSVSVVPLGGPPGTFTYNWTNSTGTSVGTTTLVNNLPVGNYTVQVSSTSCGSQDTSVAVPATIPTPQFLTPFYCNTNGPVILTVPVGSTNIQWYDTLGNIIPAPLGTKDTLVAQPSLDFLSYYVSYVDSGCTDSIQFFPEQITGGTLGHSNVTEICVGANNGQATVNLNTFATPPYSYSITGPGGFSDNLPSTINISVPLTGLSFGEYTVSANDGMCTYSDNFFIDTIPVPVSITVSPLTLCSNNSSIMTFSFSTAPPPLCQLSSTPVCANPTLYTCGPSNAVTPSLFQYPTPYGNESTKMQAQYIYQASELNAAGIFGGNISSIAFNVTNLNGTIDPYPNFNISIGCSPQSTFSEFSDQDSLIPGLINVYSNPNVNVTTGINTYNFTQPYAWDGVSNLIVDVCFEVPGTFSTTANAQVACTSTSNYSSLTITSDTDPTCVISATPVGFYDADPEQMRPVAVFGWCSTMATASMYTYSLTSSTAIVGGTVTTPTMGLQPTSTSHYTLTSTSVTGGCTKTDTFTIFVTVPFTINMPNPDTLLCSSNPTVTLNPTFTDNITGNNVTESATWSIHNNAPGITNITAFGLATFNPQVADTGKQYLVITAGGNCVIKDSVLYRVYQFKSAKINLLDSIFCINDPSVQVSVASPGGIWSGTGISAAGIFSPLAVGVTNPFVTIEYITNNGTPCADSSTAQMTVIASPTVNFTADTTQGCAPATAISFTSTVLPLPANGTYKWYFGNGQSANTQNATYTYTMSGTYSPRLVYTSNGCADSLTQTDYIVINPQPNANFYANPATTDILSPHVDFINTTTPSNCIWAWNVAGVDTTTLKNTSQNFPVAGTYVVILYATNQYNCKDSAVLNLVINGDYAFYVPSSFTPNGDGLNDLFKPVGFGLANNNVGFQMQIYNRWGQRLFETGDANAGWNGISNGVALAEDVYVYMITYADYQNVSHSLKGTVTLLK